MKTIIIRQPLGRDLQRALMDIRRKNKEVVPGICDMYDSLYVSGKCATYSRKALYYVSYTLAAKNIYFTLRD